MCIHIYYNFIKRLPRCHYRKREYLVWLDNDKCRVAFSEMPFVVNKQINVCAMTAEEIKDAEDKPLFLLNTVHVLLIDKKKNKTYTFTIKAGFDFDGASINRLFWRVIGSKEDIKFKIAALIHDVLCIHHEYVDGDRYFSTTVFDGLLFVGGTEALRRWTMKHSVDNYQKIFCNWEEEEKC